MAMIIDASMPSRRKMTNVGSTGQRRLWGPSVTLTG